MHRPEGSVRQRRREVAYIAPDARGLHGNRVFLAGAGAHRVVDGVVGVCERDHAVDDAVQGI